MKKLIVLLLAVAFAAATTAGAEETSGNGSLTSDTQKMSYALGVDIGGNLKNLPVEIDYEVFLQGIRDSVAGKELLMSPEEVNNTKRDLAQKVQAERMKERAELGEANRREGEAFLQANKEKEGVTTTGSGLQYIVLTEGQGPKPTAEDKVQVNYRGSLLDGTEFDSSFKRGKPATFPVNGVIKGWTEALQLMPVGSRWKLFIPSDLAYGERGAGQMIGPDATLVFEVELLAIEQ